MKEAAQFHPNAKGLIVVVVVILIAIVVHHVILVNRCCPVTTDTTTPTPAGDNGGLQPPYIAELRLLNGSGKRVKLETVKVNLDPMNKGSTNPEDEGWEEIKDDFQPPLTEWLDGWYVRHAKSQETPEKVYGVYVKATFEDGGTHERLIANLDGLLDTSVTLVAEIVEFECPPPGEGEPVTLEEERIVLCVAEGISSFGFAVGEWDKD